MASIFYGGQYPTGFGINIIGTLNSGDYTNNIPTDQLTKVEVGTNVTKIGESAFDSCTSLTEVIIPNSTTSIDLYAFFSCSNLTTLDLSNGVITIGESAFDSCTSLTEVIIPDSTTSIDIYAFLQCSNLTTLDLGNGVITIEEAAFQLCINLTEVIIPNSTTSIKYEAFTQCSNLITLDLGNGVINLGSNAFNSCTSLTSVTIPDTVTRIFSGTFYYCNKLTTLDLGNGVKQIDHNAFEWCSSLTEVIIPNSITYIDISVFLSCSSLTSVTIEDGNKINTIYTSSFTDVSDNSGSVIYFNKPRSIESITNTNLAYIATNYYANQIFNTVFYSDEYPSGIGKDISGTLVSSNYTNDISTNQLTKVEVGTNVTEIGESAFEDASNLTQVFISDNVTSINLGAFRRCSSLFYVTIPDSVISLGESAFDNCTSLTSVTIEDGNKINTIYTNSFTDVSDISGSVIYFNKPGSIESITNTDLRTITTNYYANQIFNTVFYGGEYPTGIGIDISGTLNSSNYTNDISKNDITKVEFGSKVTSIDNATFQTANALTQVFISENVTSIGENAFNDCSGLATVTISNVSGITTIFSNSFTDLSGSAAYPGSTITFLNVENWIVLQDIWTINGLSAEWFAITDGFENQIPPRQLPPGLSNFNIPNKVYGELPFQITPPDSSSNGAFSYDSSNANIADISGNIITIKGAGVTTITAIQEETPLYFGGSITASFEVIANDNNVPVPIESGDGLLYMLETDATYANIQEDINFNSNTTTILICNSQKRFMNETDTNKKMTG